MKRHAPVLILLCLLAALWAGGCTTRAAAAPRNAVIAAVPAAPETPAPTPSPTPAPTPVPTPTPCPHLRWKDSVCADCGLVCVHEAWDDGRCALCGLVCPHPGHDALTRQCVQCGKPIPHAYVHSVCALCGQAPVFETETLPRELFEPCERAGTVEILTYTTTAYTPEGWRGEPVETEKKLPVYLPYGYDPEEKYDVLILLHGIKCTELYWLGWEEYLPETEDMVSTKDLLDNLIDAGWCRKMIVATPTFYRDSGDMEDYHRREDEPRFLRELREDILPLLTDTYSTWAESGDPADISARREHFAFAGLSMGSIYIYTSILPKSLDLFGWFGCFSGSDGYMDQLAWTLNNPPDSQYPIYYFYNSIGADDPYYFYLHRGQYRDLVAMARGLTEGDNAAFTVTEGAAHAYNAWSTALCNFLGLVFSPQEAPPA